MIPSGILLLQTLPKVCCPSLDMLQHPNQLGILLLGIKEQEQDGSHRARAVRDKTRVIINLLQI